MSGKQPGEFEDAPEGDGQPSQNEIFTASAGFGTPGETAARPDVPLFEPDRRLFDGTGAFVTDPNYLGIDAFAPGGPLPVFQPDATSPLPEATSGLLDSSLSGRPTCEQVQQSLPYFLDGELTSAQQAAVQQYLDGCPGCRRAAMFQMSLRTVVAEKAVDAMPDDARARITRALGFD